MTGACYDLAGNGSFQTVSGINIDKTPPSLNPIVYPEIIPLNGTATLFDNASDSLSGLASLT